MAQQKSYELSEAMSRLIYHQPFFAVMLLDLLVVVEGETGDNFPIPTAGTDGKRLYINKTWFGGLALDERVFVLCHEVMHVMLGHMQRGQMYTERGLGPDLKKYNPRKMNVAMDYIINDWIIKSGNKHMPQGGMLNPQFTVADIADEVYLKIQDPPEENGGSDGTGNWDEHMAPAGNAASKTDIQRAAKSAMVSAKAAGKVPGGMERLVNELCEPQVNWAEQLRLSITASAGRDDATWARPNRKRLAVPPNVYFPGTCAHKAGRIAIYGDTSGSVTDQEWGNYFGEAAAIVDELSPEETWLGSCDYVAYDPVLVESGDDVREYKPQGGGGTRMPAIFDKLAELQLVPDVLVILTDGYTDFGTAPPYDVIWVMTTNVEAPYGRNLRIRVGQ